jgi:plastocyanin
VDGGLWIEDCGWGTAAAAPKFVVFLLASLVSCGDSPPPPPSEPPAPPVAQTPLRTGAIEGFVRVDSDDIAPLAVITSGFEKYCGKGALDVGLYRVAPISKGLSGAFIEADGRSAAFKAESIPVLDQKACLFTPVLRVVPPGPVLFKNSDAMAHNVTIRGLLNPIVGEGFGGGEAISRTFPFEEKLTVRCSIHPWMVAGLVVTGREAHAVSDEGGKFRIERVEAGRRKVRLWHLLGEELTVDADVPVDGVAYVKFDWKPRPGFRAGFGK